jgi:hypothetical protein
MNARRPYLIALALSLVLTGTALAAAQQKTELDNHVSIANTGQQWSDAQNEVWNVVLTYCRIRQADELMKYIHDEYTGWYSLDPMPVDKAPLRPWIINDENTRKTMIITIAPAGMKVFDNIAIAHYYYMELYRDEEGKQKSEQGRWTDVLMKQDGKWLLIADHGGPGASADD